jgi:glycoprotein endo-alpha-1,2-mannosidase
MRVNLAAGILSAALALAAAAQASAAAAAGDEPTYLAATNSSVMAFYYLWYGNPETDGRWLHWNHTILPHWTDSVNERYPNIGQAVATPPDGVHSRFYPSRGPYSVADRATLLSQMTELRASGVGVVVLSWWGRPGLSGGDSQGVVTDTRIGLVLSAAADIGLKVAWHLEPYEGRSVEFVRADIAYLHLHYGKHSALYRRPVPGRAGAWPLYFVYDSYHIAAGDWAEGLLGHGGQSRSLRGTELDGTFIGLWLDREHGHDLERGGRYQEGQGWLVYTMS